MQTSHYRTLSGVAFIVAGLLTVFGFITAETLYQGYSAADQTISALGASDAPENSQVVFNSAQVAAGLATLLGAYGLHHVYERHLLTGLMALTGVGGFVGVGLFPSQTGAPHFLAAMIAFGGIGITALVVATTVRGPFRYVSLVLGVLELASFVAFMTIAGSVPIGVGGIERYIAYFGFTWAIAFGGYLLQTDPAAA